MCTRNEGEKLLPYILRYIQEQPRVVMAAVGMACAVGVYVDARSFFSDQTDAFRSVAEELKELNVRVSHLEREHEAARQNENSH